jgi:hypothetical protein
MHIKSASQTAIPLLLIPSFPFTNLSLTPLFAPLSDPQDGSQAFHLVVPSLPGLGFSDAFATPPFNSSFLADTAAMFDVLMTQKLKYANYIASGTGCGTSSPSGIDYHLLRILVMNHGAGGERAEGCLGIHVIDPPVPMPKLATSPVAWGKWVVAKFFHARVWGYSERDWNASPEASAAVDNEPTDSRAQERRLQRGGEPDVERAEGGLSDTATPGTSPAPVTSPPATQTTSPAPAQPKRPSLTQRTLSAISTLTTHSTFPSFNPSRQHTTLSPPTLLSTNTLSYGLCDSPVGLLSLVLYGLRRLNPSLLAPPSASSSPAPCNISNTLRNTDTGTGLTPEEILDLTLLSWLPGPEGAIRFWSGAEREVRHLTTKNAYCALPTSVTWFEDDGEGVGQFRGEKGETGEPIAGEVPGGGSTKKGGLRRSPAWVSAVHRVVWVRRYEGRGGFVVWQRGETIVDGIRGLAGAILENDEIRGRLGLGGTGNGNADDYGAAEELSHVVVVGHDGRKRSSGDDAPPPLPKAAATGTATTKVVGPGVKTDIKGKGKDVLRPETPPAKRKIAGPAPTTPPAKDSTATAVPRTPEGSAGSEDVEANTPDTVVPIRRS